MSDRLRIVHIDDNRGDLVLAHEAFAAHARVRHEGMDEVIGAIGKVAQDAVGGSPPALIVLDLNLAGMDGVDVLKLLGANKQLRRVPVVILTSSDRQSEREACLAAGAKAFITKPATFEGLCEAAKTVLLIAGGDEGKARARVAKGGESARTAAPSA
jgi:CheY-like chemotaxis protein